MIETQKDRPSKKEVVAIIECSNNDDPIIQVVITGQQEGTE